MNLGDESIIHAGIPEGIRFTRLILDLWYLFNWLFDHFFYFNTLLSRFNLLLSLGNFVSYLCLDGSELARTDWLCRMDSLSLFHVYGLFFAFLNHLFDGWLLFLRHFNILGLVFRLNRFHFLHHDLLIFNNPTANLTAINFLISFLPLPSRYLPFPLPMPLPMPAIEYLQQLLNIRLINPLRSRIATHIVHIGISFYRIAFNFLTQLVLDAQSAAQLEWFLGLLAVGLGLGLFFVYVFLEQGVKLLGC